MITSAITLKFCIKILKKLNSFELIKKIKLFSLLFRELLKLIKISILVSKKKIFINFFFFTVLLVCFEFLLLKTIFNFLFQTIDTKIIFLFFLSNYLIRMVKPVDNIIGVKEGVLGLYGQQLGLLFVEGALIVVIWRLLGAVSLIINYIFYYSINKFSN